MNNQIAILILFFNKLHQTINCIQSFVPSCQPIYVLNNGSADNDWKTLTNRFNQNGNIKFFSSPENLGACVGRNYLIENSIEPWLLIVDNDVTVKQKKSWVSIFSDFLQKEPSAEIIHLNIFNKHENQYVNPVNVVKRGDIVSVEDSDDYITNCFPCTGTIVHRKIFQTYGLFDPNIFVGLEEYEYSLRAIFSGSGELKVYHLNVIELIHDHIYQTKRKDRDAVRVRYNEEMLKVNAKAITEKYNIRLDHDWEWWTKKQLADMTRNNLLYKMKKRIRRLLDF